MSGGGNPDESTRTPDSDRLALARILRRCELPFTILTLKDATSTVFLSILESVFESTIPCAFRDPESAEEERLNMDSVVHLLERIGVVGFDGLQGTALKRRIILALDKIATAALPASPDAVENSDDVVDAGTHDMVDFVSEEQLVSHLLDSDVEGEDGENIPPHEFQRVAGRRQEPGLLEEEEELESDESVPDDVPEFDDLFPRKVSHHPRVRQGRPFQRRRILYSQPPAQRQKRPRADSDGNQLNAFDRDFRAIQSSYRKSRSGRRRTRKKFDHRRLSETRKPRRSLAYFQDRYKNYLRQFAAGQRLCVTNTSLRNLVRDQKISSIRQDRELGRVVGSYRQMELNRIDEEERLLKELMKNLVATERLTVVAQVEQEERLKIELARDRESYLRSLRGDYNDQTRTLAALKRQMQLSERSAAERPDLVRSKPRHTRRRRQRRVDRSRRFAKAILDPEIDTQ